MERRVQTVTPAELAVMRRHKKAVARFDYADVLTAQLKALGLPLPQREYRFDGPHGRRWRFDCVWLPEMLACELNGAEWQQGRHNRGSGMAKDYEKLNAAQLGGWIVLQFTGGQVRSGYAVDVLAKALQ